MGAGAARGGGRLTAEASPPALEIPGGCFYTPAMSAATRHRLASFRLPWAGAGRQVALLLLLGLLAPSLPAQDAGLAGEWRINEKLSDSTDSRVEAALRAAGQKVQRRLFDRRKDRYRGGPEEHALYDHISYDDALRIEAGESGYTFSYDGFSREIHTDNRSRSASLSGIDELHDFSFGQWNGSTLEVEARPRDGGFTEESYRLQANGQQLRVQLYIQPASFGAAIEVLRIYDRQGAAATSN